MTFRAILFDLDGTLVNTERENAEAMARALKTGCGIEISQAVREFVTGHSWVGIYRRVRAEHPALSWTVDELIAATARERDALFEQNGMEILPGAREAVSRFAHVARGLVTGSSRVEALQSLTHLGFLDTFDVFFAAEDVPTSKPDPQGYLNAARALGVAADECLVVEDSSAGIGAGVAAGAKVVAVRAGNVLDLDQSAAHHVIDTLDELTVAFVERIFD